MNTNRGSLNQSYKFMIKNVLSDNCLYVFLFDKLSLILYNKVKGWQITR
jgi:hypothetical protein